MKKLLPVLSLLLLFSLCLSPLGFAEENTDTLVDWNLRIRVPEGKTAVLDSDGYYYIYATQDEAIPYVSVRAYSYSSLELFLSDYMAAMTEWYGDAVLTGAKKLSLGGKQGTELDYSYTVSGYTVSDRSFVVYRGGMAYIFRSKDVPELDSTVGSMLEDVIAGAVFLDAETPEPEPEDAALAAAYVYCLPDGMPKYWLDLSGLMAESPVLHCAFRSSDPTFYESWFILDYSEGDSEDGILRFTDVRDSHGFDISSWFRSLTLRFEDGALVLDVERDESTLAGGSEDNILTGSYRMEPADLGLVYDYRLDNGLRKYRLDLSGHDGLLTAKFRSGEPEYHDERFTLDSDSAVRDGDYSLRVTRVFHENGTEVSDWFESFTLTQVQGALLMNVKRNEATLAGGADDNILTGVYLLEPQTYLLPAGGAPYDAETLARAAQLYYFRETGYYPPEADAVQNADGSFTIHLYEITSGGGVAHTATSAWYTVDENGDGSDDIFGQPVSLCR